MKTNTLKFLLFSGLFFVAGCATQPVSDKIVSRSPAEMQMLSVYDDFYVCFESDSGTASYLIGKAATNMLLIKAKKDFPNREIIVLLDAYANNMSKPDTALLILQDMDHEFGEVYGFCHPLIDEYFAEMLISKGDKSTANQLMTVFCQNHPESVMGQYYLYRSETDPDKKATLLEKLKKEHPNHWLVKTLGG